jgi:hypothetical protein
MPFHLANLPNNLLQHHSFGLYFLSTKQCQKMLHAIHDAVLLSSRSESVKKLLESTCTSKDNKKMLNCALQLVSSSPETAAVEKTYALALLQWWYSIKDKQISRQKYGSYELVKSEVEKTYTKLSAPYCVLFTGCYFVTGGSSAKGIHKLHPLSWYLLRKLLTTFSSCRLGPLVLFNVCSEAHWARKHIRHL